MSGTGTYIYFEVYTYQVLVGSKRSINIGSGEIPAPQDVRLDVLLVGKGRHPQGFVLRRRPLRTLIG